MDHGDVDGLLHELRGFHDAFRECFARSEPREHFFRYMVGQLSILKGPSSTNSPSARSPCVTMAIRTKRFGS
jgi:hypothetical protein